MGYEENDFCVFARRDDVGTDNGRCCTAGCDEQIPAIYDDGKPAS
jgi:hypothetical protein